MKYSSLLLIASLASSCVLMNSYADNLNQTDTLKPIKIADKIDSNLSLSPKQGFDSNSTFTVSEPGASYIKVHFAEFNIPDGAVVEVRNPEGTESYRYSNAKRDGFTYDPELGEDGKTSWASMSVSGDTAIIQLIMPNNLKAANAWDDTKHSIKIGHYMRGFPENVIENLMTQEFSTCGGNERKDAVCYKDSHPTEFAHSRPVAKLVMRGSVCTAWRVGPDNKMFTNNHCIGTQSSTTTSEVWFNYQRSSCRGSKPNNITKVPADKMLATSRSSSLDYTLFTVKDFSKIASFGYLGLDPRDAVKGEQIYIPQHGSGNPKELSIESDSNSNNRCQIDAPNSSRQNLGYYCDTIGGSSGSPVIASKTNKVIGLHHWGGCPSGPNQAARIKDIWPEVAKHFNNKVPGSSPNGDNDPGKPDTPDNPDDPNKPNYSPLMNKLNTCLGSKAGKVTASRCDNSKAQKWHIDSKGLLHPADAPNKCLQLPSWYKGTNRAVVGSCNADKLDMRWVLENGRIHNVAYPTLYLNHFKAYGEWIGVWTEKADGKNEQLWEWK